LTGIGTDLSKIPFYDIEQIPAATFGYFGALERWQGVDLLIKSFVKVARQKDCAKLYIIGDGSLKKELERSSEILGIKEQTVFCGAVSRETLWKEYFKFFRVAVIPRRVSGGERASIKLVEALAAGKPVIATSEEGIKEMVGKKGGVMFVPPEDDEMMASAMMLLCEDGSRLLGMSHEALKTAQQFDIDLLIDRLLGSVAKKLKRLA
jgi:glycosyltransferase involved in cell wall biosynthesis